MIPLVSPYSIDSLLETVLAISFDFGLVLFTFYSLAHEKKYNLAL